MDLKSLCFWSLSNEELLQKLQSSEKGLSSHQAKEKLKDFGKNSIALKKRKSTFSLFFSQFKSPLVLIFIATAIVSLFLKQSIDAAILLFIVFVSSFLGFYQEKKALITMEKLLYVVKTKISVLRDHEIIKIFPENLVPGDVIELQSGDMVPADCKILEAKDLFVDESTLTGESYGIEKSTKLLPKETPLNRRTNTLFYGSHVISGLAKAVVVLTAEKTEFGQLIEHLKKKPQQTEFEKAIQRFSYFLMIITLILVVAIFGFNLFLQRPLIISILFSLALAIGLTPQLLPAIISVNLAHGARHMSHKKVIIKKLPAIENFGSMDILCVDKTGTLTEGIITIHSAVDASGKENEKIRLFSYLNALYQTNYENPIDKAITKQMKFSTHFYPKVDEIPYDFSKKRLSVIVNHDKQNILITKGAVREIFSLSSSVEMADGSIVDKKKMQDSLLKQFEDFCNQGFRVIAVAYKNLEENTEKHLKSIDAELDMKNAEKNMVFLGFLVLYDPLKKHILETITSLQNHGISLKVITGDNRFSSAYLAKKLELPHHKILLGSEIDKMNDHQLQIAVEEKNIFSEIAPNQKERIILSLRKKGHVVGYLGDGINDISALHAADVSISVNNAAPIAKKVSDMILLEKNLTVLLEGVQEGRRTFSNTLKYIFMATSANFGNMFSMAGVSIFLPFLPLLPKQILLMNLLTDFPEMTISTDNIDQDFIIKPLRLNIRFIAKFMTVFGLISSIFDFLTFGTLIWVFHATAEQFRVGWFLESIISATMIVLAIRTKKAFYKSRPSTPLLLAILSIVAITLLLPLSPLADMFELFPLPLDYYWMIGGIVFFYIAAAEAAKKLFYKHFSSENVPRILPTVINKN